jgi:hypothetical protein
MAFFVAFIVLTGEVRIRGRVLADRRIQPKYYWLCVGVFALVLVVVVFEAVSPPY